MGYAEPRVAMSVDEFLAWDAGQPLRHEFVDGEVFAMAGAEINHATVALNLGLALRQHLRGSACRVVLSDVKLWVEAANCYFYPDVMVTCSDADRASRLAMREAQLVVEVLSPSTAACDRGDKFTHYRRLESLREYVLVDIATRRTDVYRKGTDGLWTLHPFEGEQAVMLACIDLAIPADQLFAELEEPSASD